MQEEWSQSGMTVFSKIRLNITYDGVTINREDGQYATHDPLHDGGSSSPRRYGSAGDCYSWNSCEEARKGTFMIDLSPGKKGGKQGGLAIDWIRTSNWGEAAWGNGNFVVDFKFTENSVSGRCGGWCGVCEPSTDIYLIPRVKMSTTSGDSTTSVFTTTSGNSTSTGFYLSKLYCGVYTDRLYTISSIFI